MTQLTINIENEAILPHLKKILGALEGVSIARPRRVTKSSIDCALDDVQAGRTRKFSSPEDLFADLGI